MNKLDQKAVWLFFFESLIAYLFLFLIIAFFYFLMSRSVSSALVANEIARLQLVNTIVIWFLVIAVFSIFISFFIAKLSYENWKYEFTESTVKIEKGIIWKKYVSIPYERIQNVDIYRVVFARMLGLSDLQIHTAGYSGYGSSSGGSEGRLPGLDQKVAEHIRDQLVHKIRGEKFQGV